MLHQQGNRFGFFGASDTGKSWEAMAFARYFRERSASPKTTLIYENQRNDETYGNIEKYGIIKEITLNDLDFALPQRKAFRIVSKDLGGFLAKASLLTNTVVIFDDATSLFRKSVPNTVIQFLGLRKNQRLEIMFQLHTIKETAPSLLENMDVLVIKQTGDKLPVKDSCPNSDNVTKLIQECMSENAKGNYANFWATRVYVPMMNTIYRKDLRAENWALSYTRKINILQNPL